MAGRLVNAGERHEVIMNPRSAWRGLRTVRVRSVTGLLARPLQKAPECALGFVVGALHRQELALFVGR
jgi:hypothetical protein